MTLNELKAISKLQQKKFRETEQKFIVEGEHLVYECLNSAHYSDKILRVIIRTDYNNENLLNDIKQRNIQIEVIDTKSFGKMSDTENPQGILAIASVNKDVNIINTKSEINAPDSLIIALEEINDPGNLGTILRTAWWFNVDLILLYNCVEIFNPKVVRASQGAVFNVNYKTTQDLKEDLLKYTSSHKIMITSLDCSKNINDIYFRINKNAVIVFGNEANGVSNDLKTIKEFENIKIPGYTNCESLNVATSVGICLYAYRQKI